MLFKAVGDHLHISECDSEIILLSLVYWHGLGVYAFIAFELIRPENYSALCKSGLKQMRP